MSDLRQGLTHDHTSPITRWFIRITAGWVSFDLTQMAVLYFGAKVNVAEVAPRMVVGALLQIAGSAMAIIAVYMVHDFIVVKRRKVPTMRDTPTPIRSSVLVSILIGAIIGGSIATLHR
jgi:hypothetical protein